MDKIKVIKKLQTLEDIIDEKYETCSVASAKKLDELIEQAFETVCRRGKNERVN